jgi:hypothetical protein
MKEFRIKTRRFSGHFLKSETLIPSGPAAVSAGGKQALISESVIGF